MLCQRHYYITSVTQARLTLCGQSNYYNYREIEFIFFGRWCKEVEELHLNEQDKAVTLAKIKSLNLMDEYYFLRYQN